MANIISIHSFRGGTGKSNTSANLAALLAISGRRVAVIDTDIQSPGIHVLFGLDESSITYSLNDYLWGRLHAAERLVGIVASAVGGPGAPDAFELRGFRKRAFEAILEEEASRLRAVPELIARLRAAVAAL